MPFEDWSSKDFTLFGAALAASYADVQSTKEGLKHGATETNPLLGSHPSGQDLDRGALIAVGLATGIAHKIPKEFRSAFLGGWAGFEGGLAKHNSEGKVGNPWSDATPFSVLGAAIGYLLPSGSSDALMPNLSAYIKPATPGKPEVGISYERTF